MAQRPLLAAQRTGIAITLLPSLYAYGNFGEEPLAPAQRRFATNLVGRGGDGLLDAFLFAGDGQMVKHVMVGGKWIVRDGRHPDEAAIATRYRQVQKELYAGL